MTQHTNQEQSFHLQIEPTPMFIFNTIKDEKSEIYILVADILDLQQMSVNGSFSKNVHIWGRIFFKNVSICVSSHFAFITSEVYVRTQK